MNSNLERYGGGKHGKQNLLRDLRYLQLACKNVVPAKIDETNWNSLISKGRSMVTSAINTELSDSDHSPDEGEDVLFSCKKN